MPEKLVVDRSFGFDTSFSISVTLMCHKTSLIQPPFIEVVASIHRSEWPGICVEWASICFFNVHVLVSV